MGCEGGADLVACLPRFLKTGTKSLHIKCNEIMGLAANLKWFVRSLFQKSTLTYATRNFTYRWDEGVPKLLILLLLLL